MAEIKLPTLGENIDEAEVVKVLVSEGDTVEKDQTLLEMESDKASFDFPSPQAGRISKVHVSDGDKVRTGATLFTIEAAEKGEKDDEASPRDEKDEEKRDEEERREKKRDDEKRDEEEPEEPAAEAEDVDEEGGETVEAAPSKAAGPAARKLARELGVDLAKVDGTGKQGRVTPDDVKAHVRLQLARAPARDRPERTPLPDFERWGPVEREPLSRLRRTAARRLAEAWSSIPHVTQHETADISELEKERARYAKKRRKDEPKLTLTAVAVKAAAAALQEFPWFNSSYDPDAEELLVKRYYGIGVAVDTEHGLLVPVVRDADSKNLMEIAADVAELARRARDKELVPEEMQGGTFTITNLGGLGGTSFTPIVNAPEVAILGLSRAREKGKRVHLPLSLSYDHRVIDGADAVRFVRHLAGLLESPLGLLARE